MNDRRRPQNASSLRRFAARRGALLVVAVFALLAQGARLVHIVFASHSVCAHGEVVHAHATNLTEEGREGAVYELANDPAGDAEHDHCDAATLLHRLAIDTTFVGAPSASPIDAPRGGPGAEVRAVGALSLAPKNSPPPDGCPRHLSG